MCGMLMGVFYKYIKYIYLFMVIKFIVCIRIWIYVIFFLSYDKLKLYGILIYGWMMGM